MYQYLILIIIIIIGFLVCKKNYKNRATSINNNLLEFCYEIVVVFEKLPYDKQLEFKKSLNEKEVELFNSLITKDVSLGKNLNILQTQMFILETIMKKLKACEN
ncbi:hypothetical protein [Clostridium sp.]|uniref:hypothetical protein n=1 Tax=Clostridium sp. TaxID=1506 RepID=UPI0032171EBA